MSKMTKNKLALLALASLGGLASGAACAGSMTVDSRGGFEIFDVENKSYWFSIGGRMLVDHAWFDSSDDYNIYNVHSFPSGSHLRSLRLRLKGGVGSNWVYKSDIDFVDEAGFPGSAVLGETFIGYSGCDNFFFALGQVSVPFGMENWQALEDLPMMEMSLSSQAFAPNLGLGLYAEWHGTMFTAAAAIYNNRVGYRSYGDVLSNPVTVATPPVPVCDGEEVICESSVRYVAGIGPWDSSPGSDDLGISARVTFAPVHDDCTVYHGGLSFRTESFHEHSNMFNYFTSLEARARQTPWLFTNIPPNSVKSHSVWGVEAAARWGSLILQGEYMWADVSRDDVYPALDLRNPGGSLNYHGYYLEASYMLTGEVKTYDFENGTFGSVHPRCSKGAWEIVARHSFVNLIDIADLADESYVFYGDYVPYEAVDAQGFRVPRANNVPNGASINDIAGSAHSTGVGLNWYVNDTVRFTANYIRTNLPDQHVDVFAIRGQVVWK